MRNDKFNDEACFSSGAVNVERDFLSSETRVRKGPRIVHGEKELVEKLGRNDLCPCGSARRFQAVLHGYRAVRREQPKLLLSAGS